MKRISNGAPQSFLTMSSLLDESGVCGAVALVCYLIVIRPSLALNCLLQIVQDSSEEGYSDGGALALAFRISSTLL